MSTAKYENRRNFEMSHWPQLRQAWNDMLKPIFPGREVSGELSEADGLHGSKSRKRLPHDQETNATCQSFRLGQSGNISQFAACG